MVEKGPDNGLPDIAAWLANYKGIVTGMTLGEKLQALFKATMQGFAEYIFPLFNRAIIQEFKDQMAIHCIDENVCETDLMRQKVINFKKAWSNSPEAPADIGKDLVDLIKGQGAKVQLQAILDGLPYTGRLFDQIGVVTDSAVVASVLSIIGEVASVGQVDQLGREMRSYIDYSGLSQLTGYGYGMVISNLVTPMVTQELNTVVSATLLTPEQMAEGLNRGFLQIEEFNSELSKMGLNDHRRGILEKMATYQPTAPDLVRFAVREVYSPETAAKYGQYEDYPAQFTSEARKAGLGEDDARRYWAAHWELPSITQGYEMMHRGVITHDDLALLLKSQDVMPYWRDRLIQISYNPLTRVDVRRMYQSGVIDEARVLKSYKDIGYNEENAAALTEWTTKAYGRATDEGKAFVMGQIESSYKIKDIDSAKALDFIKKMKYSQAQADLILHQWNVEIKEVEDDNKAAAMESAYLGGALTAEAYLEKLNGLTISEKKRLTYAKAAKTAKKATTPTPSIADLAKMWNAQIIDETIYRARLKMVGYTDEVIGWYVKLNAPASE